MEKIVDVITPESTGGPLFPRPPASLVWLLAASALLLLVWSFAVPIFEAPDEPAHWQFAQFLHTTHKLPMIRADFVEALQPPLYYLLVSPFAFPSDTPPFAGDSGPRLFVNTYGDLNRFWPIRIGRIITAIISLFTVYFAYLSGVEATGTITIGLLAAGLTGFLPQFSFRGMNVSNDSLVTTLSALAVYLIIRLIRRGFTTKLAILAALALGGAALSKSSAMFLPLPFALAVLTEKERWVVRFRRLAVLGITAAMLLPWFIRNQMLYGDVLATKATWAALPNLLDVKSISSPFFRSTFPLVLSKSFVGVFGWVSVFMPEGIYWFYAALGLLGAAGCVWRFLQFPNDRRLMLILFTIPVLNLVLTIQYNLVFSQAQGRFLFPALTTIALLAAMGLLMIPRWKRPVAASLVLLLGLVNAAALGATIIPVYWIFPPGYGLPVDVLASSAAPRVLGDPLTAGVQYAQSFVSRHANLTDVRVQFATYSSKIAEGVLKLSLRDSLTSGDPIATWTIPLETVEDNAFTILSFPPVPDSEGKLYYIVFEVKAPSHPLTVWLTRDDVYADGTFFIAGKPTQRDLSFIASYKPEASGTHAPNVWIDSPLENATVTSKVHIVGWAIDNTVSPETPIGRVEVTLDGVGLGVAPYGNPRPDVCKLWPDRPGCPNVGFDLPWDAGAVKSGPHTIAVCAIDMDLSPHKGCLKRHITTR